MQYLLKESFGYLLLTLLLYIIGVDNAIAQNKDRPKYQPDSTYIETFDDWFVIKPSITNTAEALVAKTGDYNIVLEPNTNEVVRTYFSYQFISFYFDYLPHSAITNNDNDEKGTTKLFTLGTTLNHRQWFGDLAYSKTKGYFVENTRAFREDWKDGDAYIQIPDLHVTSYNASVGYNTNKRLSLAAAVSQTERQLKSAGAFLPKISLRYYIIDDRSPQSNVNEKSNNLQALLGAGYQYTAVFNRSLYLVGSFSPAFGFIHTRVQQRSEGDLIKFSQEGPIYQWEGKFGFGYNSHRFFAGSYLTATSAKYAQGLTSAENNNADVFLQLFVGFRLKAPKLISNSYKKIFR
ncbi:protein of unknown function [Pedobacter westerhofensis]|uniref:DUF4421 domain-containing protein n=1 Tax=Pedobacter westerhofensis TaxID=425512 RepID=A0A521FL70_9SPHI|nr:DUF4421 family protein [Pedobacter westerhofensis]SMO96947.1 protein of unknown function [Pedobacter westerhofensis]